MALLADRVKETTTTTGTGSVNLGGGVAGFRAFSAAFSTGNVVYYCIEGQGTGEWEVGSGALTTGSPWTLARTTIIASSNSGGAVNFSVGTKNVFCTAPASVYVGAGEIHQYAGMTAPTGWAVCNGATLNEVDYPELFAVIGHMYGTAGAGTFNLPNLAARKTQGTMVAPIQPGDIFTAHLPGDVDASYVAIAGDGVSEVAAGLCAAIVASVGYSGQAFTASVVADVITLTATTAGTGFFVSLSTATAPVYATTTANVPAVAQVDALTITGAVNAGDIFTAHLPGVDASYTAISGNGAVQVAAGLWAAITASAGYATQPFTAAVGADVITITATTPGVGFAVTTSATNGGADNTQSATIEQVVTNVPPVAQINTITIDSLRYAPWPAIVSIIRL